MATEELVERLAAHRKLAGVPREQLAWLAEQGTLERFPAGAQLYRTGDPIDHLWIVLEGRFDIHLQRGGGRRRVMEWRGGDIAGLIPFSRLRTSPGDTYSEEPTEILAVHRDRFPEMIRECQELTAILVHVMLDRARHFRSTDLQEDKLASLGRLAAGLAHELNNPASAAARGAEVLGERLEECESAFRALGACRLSEPELAAFAALRACCFTPATAAGRSPLAQAEREEELGDWLERHGLDREAAESLAETDVTPAALEAAAAALPPEALTPTVAALTAAYETHRLAVEIERAAGRVHELVAAVKGFTYMDQARTPKPVDLARGWSDTLTVLRSKAKAKSVRISTEIEPDLPVVVGLGGELNQVWANLVDNAIDAVAEGGRIEVSVRREAEGVVVRVIDDGPGIPPEIVNRIFEPFFTTKPVGEGTGLGLSIARNLIDQHEGELELESRPGRTEFRIILPVEGERQTTKEAS